MRAKRIPYPVLFALLAVAASCTSGTEEPEPSFSLSATVSPAEGGTITVSPSSGTYNQGQTVKLTPEPSLNWVFGRWEGDASGSSIPLTITMNAHKAVTGVFVKRDYPLNITIEGEGKVNEVIITNPAAKEYPHGTTVELTPVAGEGWVFESWGGELSGSETPQRITVDGEKSVTVTFKPHNNSVFYLAENGITCKCEGAKPGDKGVINGVEYEAVNNNSLRQRRAEGVDMTRLCTSLVTDMSHLFRVSTFNQPIGNWDVSKVSNMENMFYESSFNQPISEWNVRNVVNMWMMFARSSFNQPIENWDVRNVRNMIAMFAESSFNQPIGSWDVGNVTDMAAMFENSQFNQPIGDWNVSRVRNMKWMFNGSPFDQPIGNWNVSNVTDMGMMFSNSVFNQPIGNWKVGRVTTMLYMFNGNAHFNQDLSKWCVEKIPTRPGSFRTGATAWVLPEPVWGTCPE